MKAGMARIPFRLEDKLSEMIRAWHDSLFDDLMEAAQSVAREAGFRVEGGTLVADADPSAIIRKLADLIGARGIGAQEARLKLNAQLVAAERGWFVRFAKIDDQRLKDRIFGMDLPTAEVFEGRLEELRDLYLDSAVERALGEQDDLKASFLLRLADWAEGRAEKLDVDGIAQEMAQTSAIRAKFFARDQYSRFERSLSLSAIKQAEAPYVEVLSSNDARVRPTHAEWNHAVYSPEGLVADPRWEDYNCRCAFVARWDLSAEQERRFVA